MSRFGNLLAPIRRNLLDSDRNRDPFDPLPTPSNAGIPSGAPSPYPPPFKLRSTVGPLARNRADDVKRVETASSRTGS